MTVCLDVAPSARRVDIRVPLHWSEPSFMPALIEGLARRA